VPGFEHLYQNRLDGPSSGHVLVRNSEESVPESFRKMRGGGDVPGRGSRVLCTLHPSLCTLHPTPFTLHPTPYTPNPAPWIEGRGSSQGQNLALQVLCVPCPLNSGLSICNLVFGNKIVPPGKSILLTKAKSVSERGRDCFPSTLMFTRYPHVYPAPCFYWRQRRRAVTVIFGAPQVANKEHFSNNVANNEQYF